MVLRGLKQKVNTRAKTKGRFMMEFGTNGKMYMTDSVWAKTANPQAFEALKAKEDLDMKLMKKKKIAKDLQDKLWLEKQGIII